MNTMKSLLLLLLGSMWVLNGVFAKEIPARPQTMVSDFAGLLSPAERNSLELKLRAYEDSTSTQIAIVIDKSLEDEDAQTNQNTKTDPLDTIENRDNMGTAHMFQITEYENIKYRKTREEINNIRMYPWTHSRGR